MKRFAGARERRLRRADTGATWRRVDADKARLRLPDPSPRLRLSEGDELGDTAMTYARLRRADSSVRPGRWTREVAPEHVRVLTGATSPTEQAYAILDHRIPYRAVIAVLEQLPPAVMVALVEVMTVPELLLNLSSLRRRGALRHPLVAPLVERKLAAAGIPGAREAERPPRGSGGPAG